MGHRLTLSRVPVAQCPYAHAFTVARAPLPPSHASPVAGPGCAPCSASLLLLARLARCRLPRWLHPQTIRRTGPSSPLMPTPGKSGGAGAPRRRESRENPVRGRLEGPRPPKPPSPPLPAPRPPRRARLPARGRGRLLQGRLRRGPRRRGRGCRPPGSGGEPKTGSGLMTCPSTQR